MPFVLDPNLEDDKKDQGGEAASPGGTQIVSGQSGVVGSGAGSAGAGAPAAGAAPKATRSGSWTNLTSYLDANQGNDAAMGQKVQGAADTAGAKATTAGGTFKTNADTDIAKNTVTEGGVVGQIAADPSKVNKSAFDAQKTAEYKGPKAAVDIAGWNDADKAYKGASDIAGLAAGKDEAASKAGVSGQDQRASVLGRTDVFGRPSYTQGEKNLDSFILGGGAQGQQSLQQIQNQYGAGSQFQGGWGELQKQIGGIGQAGSAIDNAKLTTDKTRTDTIGAYDTAASGLKTKLDTAKAAAADKTKGQIAEFDKFGAGDPAALKAAGLTDEQIRFVRDHGIDPRTLARGGKDYRVGDMAAEGDVANYQALMKLAGQDPSAGYDFSKGGENWSPDVAGLKDALNFDNAVDAKWRRDRGSREREFMNVQNAIDLKDYKRFAAATGIDPGLAYQIFEGVTPDYLKKYVKQGRSVTAGDTMSDADRQRWSSLMDQLGVSKGRRDITDPGDEGKAFDFDLDRLLKDAGKSIGGA